MLKNKLINSIEILLAWLVFAIWLTVVALVALRYIFNSSIPGANEWIVILFVYATSLGAALGFGKGGHLAIEFAVEKIPTKFRRRFDLLRTVLIGLLHVVIVVLSIYWIWMTGHFLMPSTGLPRWVAQISIPIGGLLGLVFILIRFQEQISIPSNANPSPGKEIPPPERGSQL
ncbi:MAG: TRAP transporter small permease [Verrucomicrobia bacterium]|jgi:C4-dicarboxylate transporter, DctQ subunit|nr:TRAP transporter small permease [Verrucomicrobiota bacterium]